jgi:excisionase family DNA binding protein
LKEILNIDELSEYLSIKKSSLYSKVEMKEIPFYRIGRLLRFKKAEIDHWLEKSRVAPIPPQKEPKQILPGIGDKKTVDKFVQNAIAGARSPDYTLVKGRPHRIRVRGLGKEVSDGTL